MIENEKFGAEYRFELVRAGVVVDEWVQRNIAPTQGRNHILDVVLNGASPVTAWHVGIYGGDYTPIATDTMANFPALASETTAYVSATRAPLVTAAASAGVVSNIASRAEFEFTADATVRGGFISSSSAKGGTSGVLLSAARFLNDAGEPISKVVAIGDVLRVTAGISLEST